MHGHTNVKSRQYTNRRGQPHNKHVKFQFVGKMQCPSNAPAVITPVILN